jgi:hypothetical protein
MNETAIYMNETAIATLSHILLYFFFLYELDWWNGNPVKKCEELFTNIYIYKNKHSYFPPE